MFQIITNLLSALAQLTGNILALSSTVRDINSGLRQRLHLEETSGLADDSSAVLADPASEQPIGVPVRSKRARS